MRAVFLSLRQFQAVIQGQSLLVATDNSTVVAYLQNQGGTHSFSLYHLSKEILLLCHSLDIILSVRHVPGSQNLLADALSRSRVPVNTEWEIHPSVFQEIILRWDRPHIDLFATSLNHKLETYVSPIPDEKAWAVDAMTLSWKGMFSYMFPPFRLLPKILHKIQRDLCKTILIAPAWPRQSWFPELLLLCCAKPLCLPLREDLLSQFKGRKLHQGLENLHLHAWLLSGIPSEREAFLREQPSVSQDQSDNLQEQCYDSKWSIFCTWCLSKQIDPITVTVQQLADFFLHLFEEKGYSPSTIKGYRSAIARTISLSGGSDFGDNEFLSLLIKNTFALIDLVKGVWFLLGT
ncbi:Hypothetical predicted protein [Mytilus galloprovincialis]|uniref:Core-binding (CB) domain-containing protein n=1 Tax=Mytilus galloprovincialis TaxID=29158 RepID=A0A8B6H0V1_MYTGA|nr:Hypothetical predicted protein [Mytilus galloprovincialis]